MDSNMLVWVGVALAAAGLVAIPFDLRTADFFHTRLSRAAQRRIRRVTDIAKGAVWLVGAFAAYGGVQLWIAAEGETALTRQAADLALAFLVAMVAASAILHGTKLLLGRRRPRDYFQHGLSGVRAFALDGQYDSFPSGHAVTIFCVAVFLSAMLPAFAPAWFALAGFLALTRAMLTSHYLSDVLCGSALGVIVARETLVLGFPHLAPAWF
jgi:membrane-associated phospholipid phosphatase